MGLNASTLNGHRVTSARVNIPAWGCWYADASIDGEASLTGSVELKIADLTLRGTVLSGGPAKGRADYRIIAGAGGWGRSVKRHSYANDGGVRMATVLGDAASLVGETLAPIDRARSVGPAFTRQEGPAARLLEQLSPRYWYVDEGGTTRLGARAPSVLTGKVTHGPVDRARATVTLAAESIAGILPGIVVDGMAAVDVQHDISAKDGVRTRVWGATGAGMSRHLSAFKAILDQLDPNRAFRGVTEYRVVTQTADRLNLQPIRVSTGMPDLKRVPVRPGVSGCKSTVMPGSRVLVGFVDSDPGRPVVLAFEDGEGEGFQPLATDINALVITLAEGVRPAAATGDLAGPFPIVGTAVRVLV